MKAVLLKDQYSGVCRQEVLPFLGAFRIMFDNVIHPSDYGFFHSILGWRAWIGHTTQQTRGLESTGYPWCPVETNWWRENRLELMKQIRSYRSNPSGG